jgi:uncharacterized protein YukE
MRLNEAIEGTTHQEEITNEVQYQASNDSYNARAIWTQLHITCEGEAVQQIYKKLNRFDPDMNTVVDLLKNLSSQISELMQDIWTHLITRQNFSDRKLILQIFAELCNRITSPTLSKRGR